MKEIPRTPKELSYHSFAKKHIARGAYIEQRGLVARDYARKRISQIPQGIYIAAWFNPTVGATIGRQSLLQREKVAAGGDG